MIILNNVKSLRTNEKSNYEPQFYRFINVKPLLCYCFTNNTNLFNKRTNFRESEIYIMKHINKIYSMVVYNYFSLEF